MNVDEASSWSKRRETTDARSLSLSYSSPLELPHWPYSATHWTSSPSSPAPVLASEVLGCWDSARPAASCSADGIVRTILGSAACGSSSGAAMSSPRYARRAGGDSETDEKAISVELPDEEGREGEGEEEGESKLIRMAFLEDGKDENRGGGSMTRRVGGRGGRMSTFMACRSDASSSSCLMVSRISLCVSSSGNIALVGELKGVAS